MQNDLKGMAEKYVSEISKGIGGGAAAAAAAAPSAPLVNNIWKHLYSIVYSSFSINIKLLFLFYKPSKNFQNNADDATASKLYSYKQANTKSFSSKNNQIWSNKFILKTYKNYFHY